MISERGLANSAAELLPAGTVILSRTASVGYSGIMPVAMATSQDFWNWVCGPRLRPEFLLYALRAMRQVFEQATMGSTHRTIYQSDAAALSVCVPPLPEQHAIASFLDAKTATLDTLISRKRELIEKLKEKRAALISRTVTRGLPPDAARTAGVEPHPRLEPAGVAWLGEVPEHWGARQLRHLTKRIEQGWSPNAANAPADAGQWGVLKLSAVAGGVFFAEENKAIPEEELLGKPITPKAGDLLISRANTPGRVGDACVVPSNHPRLIIPDLLYRLSIDGAVAAVTFVCWVLLSRFGRARIEADARGSSGSMVKLGQGHVMSWFIPFPPIPEQDAIATFLDRETRQIDALISKVEDAITRLQEYRAALITAAVTGKIDVRDFAGEPVAV